MPTTNGVFWITAARFYELKDGATPVDDQERRAFERELLREKRSNAAKKRALTAGHEGRCL